MGRAGHRSNKFLVPSERMQLLFWGECRGLDLPPAFSICENCGVLR